MPEGSKTGRILSCSLAENTQKIAYHDAGHAVTTIKLASEYATIIRRNEL